MPPPSRVSFLLLQGHRVNDCSCSAPSPAIPPPPIQSANCPLPSVLAQHDGTGMQTALIMTFTVFTTVCVWEGTPRSSGPARWVYNLGLAMSNTQVPARHNILQTVKLRETRH